MSSHLNSTKENRELHRPNPLRGFWNRKNAKAGPCISRPDLVNERNEASQVTRYELAPSGDGEWCVVRRSSQCVVYPETGFTSRDNCEDWIAWGVAHPEYGTYQIARDLS